MPNLINELLVREYKDRYQESLGVVAVGYPGMDANAINRFRDRLAENDIAMQVIKNRIAKLAFEEMGYPDIMPICAGQTALATGEDPIAVARFMVEYAKKDDHLKIHGAMVENTLFDGPATVELSKSPTKDELKSIISGQALSPGAKLVGALMGPAGTIAGQLKKRIEDMEEREKGAA